LTVQRILRFRCKKEEEEEEEEEEVDKKGIMGVIPIPAAMKILLFFSVFVGVFFCCSC